MSEDWDKMIAAPVAEIDEEQESEDDGGLYEHIRLQADKGQSLLRVDKFLFLHLQDTSRNRIQKAAGAGFIRVNDKPVKSNYKVKPLDTVTVWLDHPPFDTSIEPENIPLNIIYEDEDVLVVNKPVGMVVHPGCGNYTGTLVNALAWYMKNSPDFDINDPGVGLVHRIDKDTSGLLVIAKTADAKTKLGLQFFNKTTSRKYTALIWGDPGDNDGRIEGNIGRDPKDRLRMTVFPPDSATGKPAVTHWHVLRRYRFTTLLECVLETGRTHQIRAHMASIGHPLFSDARYGGDKILFGTTESTYRQFIHRCFDSCPRQALHAKTLGFVHPRTGKQMDFTSQLPEDFANLVELWENHTTKDNI